MLLSRLSVEGAQLLATCNPEGPLHWLKKDFLDQQANLNLKTWKFILDDNPALDEGYKRDIKKEYNGAWYSRYILGEWAIAQGIIFDNFDSDNVFEHEMESPSYYIAGVDYGTTNPTSCHLIAVSPTRYPQICVEEELYFDASKSLRSKTDAELADSIRAFVSQKSLRALYIDPAAASLKLELRNRDLPVVDAKNDVLFGIKIVSKFLAGKNLLIHKRCKNLLEQMQSYCWDEKASDRGEDKPKKVNDHACDSLRYAVASAFPNGDFGHPDEILTIDQLRRKVYSDDSLSSFLGAPDGGYF